MFLVLGHTAMVFIDSATFLGKEEAVRTDGRCSHRFAGCCANAAGQASAAIVAGFRLGLR